jgi:hypothetical protein
MSVLSNYLLSILIILFLHKKTPEISEMLRVQAPKVVPLYYSFVSLQRYTERVFCCLLHIIWHAGFSPALPIPSLEKASVSYLYEIPRASNTLASRRACSSSCGIVARITSATSGKPASRTFCANAVKVSLALASAW